VSLIAATTLLLVARGRHSFAWVTASFTNASIRLFPCSMDLLRAIKGGRFFPRAHQLSEAMPPNREGLCSQMARAGFQLVRHGVINQCAAATSDEYYQKIRARAYSDLTLI